MKITKRQIRRIIKEEISSNHLPRLIDILFEEKKTDEDQADPTWNPEDMAPAEELEAWMDTPLASLPQHPAESLSDEAQKLATQGDETVDGSASDDTIIAGGGGEDAKPLAGLKASQNEVGMKQSLANVLEGKNATWDGIDWGDVKWLIDAMKPGATITFAAALLGATTSDGNVVLDGHHRWSQATMVNPDAKVNIILSDASGMSADDVLKAVHLAILKKTGQAKTKAAKGGNLFNASEADVRGHLAASARKVDPETHEPSDDGVAPYIAAVMKVNDITDVEEGTTASVERVLQAIESLSGRIVGGAPDRTKMPQADNETNPLSGADATAALDSGGVNYEAPFIKESYTRNNDKIIVERWQRLAGLTAE